MFLNVPSFVWDAEEVPFLTLHVYPPVESCIFAGYHTLAIAILAK